MSYTINYDMFSFCEKEHSYPIRIQTEADVSASAIRQVESFVLNEDQGEEAKTTESVFSCRRVDTTSPGNMKAV